MQLIIKATAIHHDSEPVVKHIESTPDIPRDVIGEIAIEALQEACKNGCDPVETTLVITFREVIVVEEEEIGSGDSMKLIEQTYQPEYRVVHEKTSKNQAWFPPLWDQHRIKRP
jgi:hypothetical protein